MLRCFDISMLRYLDASISRCIDISIYRHNEPKLWLFLQFQDDAGGTDGEEGAVFDDAALALRQFHVVDESSGIAVVIAQGIAQVAPFVAAYGDGAMVQVDAGVDGLEWGVDGIALLIAANHVVAHLEGDDLLVVEHVLNDDDAAKCRLGYLLTGVGFVLLFLGVTQFGYADADAKLLAAVWALEYQ